MDLFTLELATLFYGLAAVGYLVSLIRNQRVVERGAAVILASAFVLHTWFIVARGFSGGAPPVLAFTEGLAFFGWLVVGVYLVSQARFHLAGLGAVVAPLAFVSTVASTLFASGGVVLPESWRSPWLLIHVTLAFLGNAVFAVTFGISSLYLVQENLVKTRSRGSLIRSLPPLGRLDRLNHLFLVWGFALLTLGILSGGVWSASSWGYFWTGEPREILAVLTWLLYAALLQLRLAGGLRGKRAARSTIFAFVVLVLCYLFVNIFPLPGRHGGGLSLQ